MRAHAAVSVARQDGHDRLVTLRSDPPLTFRPTPTGLHLVGTSAGPLAGDDLRLDIAVGAGAELTVRSVAATLTHPGARPGASVLRIDAEVGAGGRLVWVPEPTVAVRGCDHETRVRVVLGEGATLVWRDEVVLGRHGEEPGSLLTRLAVDRAARAAVGAGRSGAPLLRNDLAVGPRWPGSLGPAGVGARTRAVGTAVLVGPGVRGLDVQAGLRGLDAQAGLRGLNAQGGVRAAVLPLAADDAVMITAVAPSAGAVSALLTEALGAFLAP